MKIIIFFVLHIIGFIATIAFHQRNGTIKFASKYGEGIRFAKPSDVIFVDLIIWEFLVLVAMFDFIGNYINRKCARYY